MTIFRLITSKGLALQTAVGLKRTAELPWKVQPIAKIIVRIIAGYSDFYSGSL